ncbi:hypothetical protein [Phenylobacterium immobile]|uniref:hypothetical protein n=1 Tax=Phenylobacterium immobile TaxID=21 RepID=UPI000B111605|nr:hypothetical protein [Phenylobacterium immobile]
MSALLFALALLAQDATLTTAASETPAAAPGLPRGAPRDDYQLVAWCYGALRGYVDLYDEVMPEVTRIETTYRAPGSSLAADLKVYADQRSQGRKDLVRFQAALTAAEKASMRPLNAQGGEAVRRGRNVWSSGPDVSKARKAQEWMSWSLPAVCGTTADALQTRSALMAPALRANTDAPPATEPPPANIETAAAPVEPVPASPASEAATPSAASAEPASGPVVIEDAPAAGASEAPSEGQERPWTRRMKRRQEALGRPAAE